MEINMESLLWKEILKDKDYLDKIKNQILSQIKTGNYIEHFMVSLLHEMMTTTNKKYKSFNDDVMMKIEKYALEEFEKYLNRPKTRKRIVEEFESEYLNNNIIDYIDDDTWDYFSEKISGKVIDMLNGEK